MSQAPGQGLRASAFVLVSKGFIWGVRWFGLVDLFETGSHFVALADLELTT